MKAFVIAIEGLKESEEAAQRCIDSGKDFGIDVELWGATTPETDRVERVFQELGYPDDKFSDNKWSRKLPAMAAFLSHSTLWSYIEAQDEMVLCMEHDAVITGSVPNFYAREKIVCNVAKPSFGAFKRPMEGFRAFSSNPMGWGYFKGLHGYLVSPSGASALLEKTGEAEPADIFVNRIRFPWLTEWYPWCVDCRDEISTIQKKAGCRAKHRDVKPI